MRNVWTEFVHRRLVQATCVLCGAPGADASDLCRACASDLPRVAHACSICAIPLVGSGAGVCGACLQGPPPFAHAFAAFQYEEPVRRLVQQLKFRRKLHLARLLGRLMAEQLELRSWRPDLIIPVPLHRRRLRERGYNQALELARPIADRLSIPIDATSCVRTEATAAQSDLPAEQRIRNVRGVFAIQGAITAQRVAIVDDVMTTGATVAELTRVLRRRGVGEVEVWVCARAPR